MFEKFLHVEETHGSAGDADHVKDTMNNFKEELNKLHDKGFDKDEFKTLVSTTEDKLNEIVLQASDGFYIQDMMKKLQDNILKTVD